MFGILDEDKAKVLSVLEMQANNFERKKKGIDQKSDTIDCLSSATE
jgi:hypothetical protein